MKNQQLTQFDGAEIAEEITRRFDSNAFNEDACRRALLPLFRPALLCPGCGVEFDADRQAKIMEGRTVTCSCGRKSAPKSTTVLESTQLEFRQVLMIITLRAWGVHIMEIAQRTGVSDDTIRRLYGRLGVAA